VTFAPFHHAYRQVWCLHSVCCNRNSRISRVCPLSDNPRMFRFREKRTSFWTSTQNQTM